jgi:ABC-2 type transport system ATP-binding protein
MTENNNTVINISHLTKRFGDLVAVDNLDLRIFQGEVFGIWAFKTRHMKAE